MGNKNIYTDYTFLGGATVKGLPTPSAATDAANKAYVDNAIAGLSWKDNVRATTTGAVTLATALENGDAIDGVTLATGDRILVKDQAAPAENGIYTVNASGAPTRATDSDLGAEVVGTIVQVDEGTVNANTIWLLTTNAPITLGATSLAFIQFTGASYTAGDGLDLTGSVFSTDLLAGGGLVIISTELALDTAVAVRKYGTTIGNGALTSFTITHGLGTLDVIVAVYEVSTGALVECTVTVTSTTVVTLVFTVAPTTNQFRVVVHA